MYSDEVIAQALKLLAEGNTPGQVSRMMGGKPTRAIIYRWAKGELPTGERKEQCVLTAPQKEDAILRTLSGESDQAVADDVGCSVNALRLWRSRWIRGGEMALRTRIDRYLDARG